MEKVRVLFVGVGKDPEVMWIENTLEAKQELVGGYIEMCTPPIHDDTAVVICNEEEKLMGMEPNKPLLDDMNRPYDIVCGDFFIIDAPIDSDDFDSLSDEQIAKYTQFYGNMKRSGRGGSWIWTI